ncbi:MAG: von willebrand factor type a, partial [Methylobacterium sp.]
GTPTVNDADSARDAVDALTASACRNAKATGISIYTIGFSVPSDPIDSAGLNLLSNCATTASQSFVANDSNSLISAFNQIAASIGTLRLTQ